MESVGVKLSVIVPVYNKELYLAKCMESLHRQQTPNVEFIFVNDGSTDSSRTIIEKFLHKDSRFRCVEQPNNGVSVARNTGMSQAKGEWLMFVDADDFVVDSYLSDILEKVARVDADLYIWGLNKLHPDGTVETVLPKMNGIYTRHDFCLKVAQEQYRDRPGLYGYVANKLIRRSIVEKHGLKFSCKLRLMEDYDFFLSYYALVDSIYLFGNCGYSYVVDAVGSSIRNVKNVDYVSLVGVQYKCLQLLRANGVACTESEELIKNNMAFLAEIGVLELSEPRKKKLLELSSKYRVFDVEITNLFENRGFLRKMINARIWRTAAAYLRVRRLYIALSEYIHSAKHIRVI